MAFQAKVFLMCAVMLGFAACGPSMEAEDFRVQVQQGAGDDVPEDIGGGPTSKEMRIDSFLAQDRSLQVMVKDSGTTYYAADANLTLRATDQFELNVTWTTGEKETFKGDFERMYSSESPWDLEFDNGGILLSETTWNGVDQTIYLNCADVQFTSGPIKSTRFILCDN